MKGNIVKRKIGKGGEEGGNGLIEWGEREERNRNQ